MGNKSMCIGRMGVNKEPYTAAGFDKMLEEAFYPGGKKNSHQNRIPKETLENFKKEIKKQKEAISECRTFDELLGISENSTIDGIGPLTEYDIAFRYGRQIGIYPDKVYLHAGTKIGAKNLGIVKRGAKYLTKEELPAYLKAVEPWMVEDFLCVEKDNPSEKALTEYLKKYKSKSCNSTEKKKKPSCGGC